MKKIYSVYYKNWLGIWTLYHNYTSIEIANTMLIKVKKELALNGIAEIFTNNTVVEMNFV